MTSRCARTLTEYARTQDGADLAPVRAQIEQQFAVACMEQAETYWNLITKIKPSTLHRLTKYAPFMPSSPDELS